MNKNKESLNRVKQNQIWFSVLEKQAQKYKEFLDSIRTQNKKVEKESEIKLNPDFLKAQEKVKEEIQLKSNEEKPLFISKKIQQLKDVGSKIKDKVTDFQTSKLPKDELFKELESQIKEFEVMIEQLKISNRALKKELELLIERELKLIQKNTLEKENKTVEEKIENIKNKDKTPFDADFSENKLLKINKITYVNSQEQER